MSTPNTPPQTPEPGQTSIYYGWYSDAIQHLRICNPTEHKNKNKTQTLMSPPFTYWKQDDKLVLLTEVTLSPIPTARQIKNGDIYLGIVDKYHGRSYRILHS